MKGLLHSKKFRTNLYRWLFAYVGVIMLLTTVITYSKYISSMSLSAKKSPAKFKVAITQVDYDEDTTYRPTSEITYKFKVDTTEIEVLTELKIYVAVNSDFKIESIKDSSNVDAGFIFNDTNTSGLLTTLLELDRLTNEETYTVKLKYYGTLNTGVNPDEELNNIMTIGYHMEQKRSVD